MESEKIPIRQVLEEEPKQYLELWKWFTEDADRIKGKMWTMAVFFYTSLGALLGFATNLTNSGNVFQFENPRLLFLVSLIGFLYSGYGIYMIYYYGKHIQSSWNRADYLRIRIRGLSEIWNFGMPKSPGKNGGANKKFISSIPVVAARLIYLLLFFALLYLVLFLMSLNQMMDMW